MRPIRFVPLVVALACAPLPAPQPQTSTSAESDALDPAPPWDYAALRDGALNAIAPLLGETSRAAPPPGVIEEMRVLAWHITDDQHRPLRIERALLWLRLAGQPSQWALANLFRHPLSDPRWVPAMATHSPYFGARLYTHPPRNADVYALLDVLQNWHFSEDPAAPLVGADVRERTWADVIGERPARFYPREVRPPANR